TVTATEKELDMESVYDTLFAYSNKFSTIWIKIVGLIAEFTDSSDGLSLEHKFPKDFKLKTVNALMNDLKEAKESNAPSFLKVEIQNDIANKVYADNPDAMKRYKIKQQHIPFSGKSPEEIQIVISLNLTRKQDKVLYANFDSIFEEIEKEQFEKQSDFYQMPYDERVKLIDEKVSAYITSIDESNNTAFQLPTVE
ncbi:MAG: hypothetical protein KC589_09220, partial [Nanoarchaeota archaeon]|nr:hypothetical protein [Nanoarchaeota archaeon]